MRLLRPWDFPGKSAGVGCHCLLQLSVLPKANWVSFAKCFPFYCLTIVSTVICSWVLVMRFINSSNVFLWHNHCKNNWPRIRSICGMVWTQTSNFQKENYVYGNLAWLWNCLLKAFWVCIVVSLCSHLPWNFQGLISSQQTTSAGP